MRQLIDFLPWRLRSMFVRRYFGRHNVIMEGLPAIIGMLPKIENKGVLRMAANCMFRSFRLRQHFTVRKDATLEIGDGAFFNDGVNLCATLEIRVGRHAKIGDQTYIYDSDFHQVAPDAPVRRAPVSIGNNVWIGANSMILAGASIGDNSVIAAGSIVVGAIAANCLAAGAPAKVVRALAIPEGWVRS